MYLWICIINHQVRDESRSPLLSPSQPSVPPSLDHTFNVQVKTTTILLSLLVDPTVDFLPFYAVLVDLTCNTFIYKLVVAGDLWLCNVIIQLDMTRLHKYCQLFY